MKNIVATVLATLAVLLGASAFAQSPSFAEVCESQSIPTRAQYESNPGAYADNFCALATYAPHRAARQFNSMVALVRSHNNPNRFYLDTKRGAELGAYIQLLRPWMAEQNAAGTHDWVVYQYDRNDMIYLYAWDEDDPEDPYDPFYGDNPLVWVNPVTDVAILNRTCNNSGCTVGQEISVMINRGGSRSSQGVAYGSAELSTKRCAVDGPVHTEAFAGISHAIAYAKWTLEALLDDLQDDCTEQGNTT